MSSPRVPPREEALADEGGDDGRVVGPRLPEAAELADRLAQGDWVSDDELDALYPPHVRSLSSIHWSPIAVARRAAQLLVTDAGTRVLDVGAGCGKLCLVGALTTGASFTGIEQSRWLVDVATETARRLGVPRATFLHGGLVDVGWEAFDAFYFYNPFADLTWSGERPAAGAPRLSLVDFDKTIVLAQTLLARLRPGSRVVTYHGMGGDLPAGYERVAREPAGTDQLEVWLRR